MPKICDLAGVRGGDMEFPVQLYRDEETDRIVIRGINEGGFACIDIDLGDLFAALGIAADLDDIAAAATAGEYRHRH